MSDYFVGEILLFAGSFAPRGFMPCAGQQLVINNNQALFSLLGTQFGGDGRVTFALPDLRGRVPIGINHSGPPNMPVYNQGNLGGVEFVTLAPGNLPEHSHLFNPTISAAVEVSTEPGTINGANGQDGNYMAAASTGPGRPVNKYKVTSSGMVALAGASLTAAAKLSQSGGTQSHYNMQPYSVIGYHIFTGGGTYPARN